MCDCQLFHGPVMQICHVLVLLTPSILMVIHVHAHYSHMNTKQLISLNQLSRTQERQTMLTIFSRNHILYQSQFMKKWRQTYSKNTYKDLLTYNSALQMSLFGLVKECVH